ncbi:MAG: hypothetical protein WBP58_02015 [Chitinophagaceae bacterium]
MKNRFTYFLPILCLSFFCFLLSNVGMAQQSPKKAPTPLELEQMKKKAQAELNKLTPEQRKKMAEMGIEMPDLDGLDKASGIAKANPGARRTEMPTRDAARIASIPTTPSVNTLAAYIKKVHQQASAKLGGEVAARGDKLYASLQAQSTSVREMGHLASGLWAMGKYQDAIYLEGKICSMDQRDPDNLSNYAAFLTMAGAEPLAIPMLRVLNTMYPRNSTILNNLGQAWFGLGDFTMSTRYLDSAIRFFPGHAQANFTKSQIEESKGNKEGAVEAMKKSLDNAYSTEKETRLRKLGYPVDKNDVSWPLHIPQDPLGLHKFVLPAFPRDVLESVALIETWDDFKKQLRRELDALKEKRYRLEAANAEYHGKQIGQSMKAVKTGAPIQSQGPLSLRAHQKLTYLMNDKDGGLSYQWKKAEEDYVNKGKLLRPIFAEREEKSKQIEKKFECLFGEGQCQYTMKDYCTAVDQMNTEYLASANGVEERSVNAMLDILRKWINTQAYYQQYYYPETQFEVTKVDYQMLWLGILESVKPQFLLPHPECYKDKQPFKPSTLQEFDDVACNYHSTLEFEGFSIQTDCSRMTTKFTGGPIDFEIKEDLNKNEIMRGSLELSAGKSADIEKGPVKAEVKGSVAGRVEFDNRGVTDVIVKVEAEVEVGISSLTEGPVKLSGTGERTVVVGGVEGRMGWNSGSSVTGKGILQGVQIK